MDVLATDSYSRHNITFGELRPGDIVLAANGDRAYAAFDVDHGKPDENGMHEVTIWTAKTDQAKGKPETLRKTSWEELRVARRDGGPRTTHTAL